LGVILNRVDEFSDSYYRDNYYSDYYSFGPLTEGDKREAANGVSPGSN
jgi:hypothetical protein